ncbi:hypothetical protein [Actinocorallia libanotica]|uniref:Neocarzinostatin family protein n=1 Tax=Actinocorallia libanotica TaxID=46162 RepID=A0ABN1R2Q0_9ACTN
MKSTRSQAAALVLGSALGLTVATATPAAAASVRVTPAGSLTAAGATVTVSGSGFDAAGNNGFGIYVVFGPKKANFSQDANAFGAARWVHVKGGGAGPGQAALAKDGSFSTTLSVKARYTDGNGDAVDCLKTPCYILTFAAHGSPDRSQDTSTPLTFKGVPAADDGDGGAKPSKAAAAPSASASPSPAKTARTTAGSAPTDGTPVDGAGAPALAAAEEVEARTISSSDAAPAWPFWTAVGAVFVLGFAARAFTRRRPARR